MSDQPRRVIILGSTGSIGTQTIQALANIQNQRNATNNPDLPLHRIVALAAGSNANALLEQARQLNAKHLALANPPTPTPDPPSGTTLRLGPDAAEQLIRDVDADIVVAAIVGAAGLRATLAAIELGRDILIANKETLVAAGDLVINAAKRSGSKLIPVDSEHAAAWQALASHHSHQTNAFPPFTCNQSVQRITLTASGGALRDWPIQQINNATPEQALKHPNWKMGAKVTIDSASLMNKAFELVEARWLFGTTSERLNAIIHPQSIIHAIVDYTDGSSIAQIGEPSMLTPIQYALTAPHRTKGLARPASLADIHTLDFHQPDTQRFPALQLGYDIIDRAGNAGAIVNAANETAIEAFLNHQIPFGTIPAITRQALEQLGTSPLRSLQDAIDADREARHWVQRALNAKP